MLVVGGMRVRRRRGLTDWVGRGEGSEKTEGRGENAGIAGLMMDTNRGRWVFGVYTIQRSFYMGLGRDVYCAV